MRLRIEQFVKYDERGVLGDALRKGHQLNTQRLAAALPGLNLNRESFAAALRVVGEDPQTVDVLETSVHSLLERAGVKPSIRSQGNKDTIQKFLSLATTLITIISPPYKPPEPEISTGTMIISDDLPRNVSVLVLTRVSPTGIDDEGVAQRLRSRVGLVNLALARIEGEG